MLEIKRLDQTHHADFKKLNTAVRDALVNKAWFMPLSDENLEHMFDPESTLVVCGAFVGGELAAVSLFDCNTEEFAELAHELGISEEKKGAELGASMVLPKYRGRNLMFSVNQKLIEEARNIGIAYFVATAHPDNIASNTSLKKLGMNYMTTLTRSGGHLRNVYLMEL